MVHLEVEVAYATPACQCLMALTVPAGTTVEEAIRRSGILEQFPEIDLSRQQTGIFSQVVLLTQVLQAGDRVEIYRPLVQDPKEARRRRAAQSGRQRK